MKIPLYLVSTDGATFWTYFVSHPAIGPLNFTFGHVPTFLELKNALIGIRNTITVVDADLGNDAQNATLVNQQANYFPQAGLAAVPVVPLALQFTFP